MPLSAEILAATTTTGDAYLRASDVAGYLSALADDATAIARELGDPAPGERDYMIAVAHLAIADGYRDAAANLATALTHLPPG